MPSNKLTIGSDPEIFVAYYQDGQAFVEPPVIFRKNWGVNADMENPKHPVFMKQDGVTLMEDGVAFEFTIPPTKKPFDLYSNILLGISMTKDLVAKLDTQSYFTWVRPVINFDISRFNPENLDEEIWNCMVFGCDPDDDAIELGYSCEILDVSTHKFRYGGGHFHVGSEDEDEIAEIHKNPLPFTRLLAITIGNIVIANSNYLEEEKQRTHHYGKPGRFRVQPHGIEYRTPSNSWIQSLRTMEYMFEAVNYAFYLLQNPMEGKKVLKEYLFPTVKAISQADQKLAEELARKLQVM